MKKKTIEKNIIEKFNEFLGTITDESVKKLVKNNSLISGGCIASMLLKEKVNDYDIYFTNKETVLAVAEYYVKKYDSIAKVVDVDSLTSPDLEFFAERGLREKGRIGIWGGRVITNKKGVEAEEDVEIVNENDIANISEKKYEPLYFSPNAISLTDKIQIILRFYGSPEEIHTNYDYIHCTNYWLSKDESLYLNQPALEAILAKELIYTGSKYPIASVIRTRKFLKRGWTINAGMYLKMCFQISKLDLEDISVLEDQLVGVDVAYFITLIEALKNAQEAHKNDAQPFKINFGYLTELINKIF